MQTCFRAELWAPLVFWKERVSQEMIGLFLCQPGSPRPRQFLLRSAGPFGLEHGGFLAVAVSQGGPSIWQLSLWCVLLSDPGPQVCSAPPQVHVAWTRPALGEGSLAREAATFPGPRGVWPGVEGGPSFLQGLWVALTLPPRLPGLAPRMDGGGLPAVSALYMLSR